MKKKQLLIWGIPGVILGIVSYIAHNTTLGSKIAMRMSHITTIRAKVKKMQDSGAGITEIARKLHLSFYDVEKILSLRR